ncbi:ribosomal protein L7/L12 [Fulvivirgaceae bacterium PWU4]|uniref:Ribosomal protein L7/L12 n=1 Tax=Chryseosolibacter histidini TaxID=2782349 RepID=A0AAP2DGF7_9BACT|nr:ribosomal protein L7/L12 [Chryseosolibacter histidini]MBT1695896.1 ribosomal protein L7/L12 [Chryseosolibacter histidini]
MSHTHHYFQSYESYFWQWEDDGDVIAIPRESTIVYKDFVGDIIEKLSPQGLPPFGSLLLTLIATNPNGAASLDTVYDIVSKALKTTDDASLRSAIDFLKLLTGLPPAYKQGKRRIMLFQVLFEGCHNILSLRSSASIYAQYKDGIQDFEKISRKISLDRSVIDNDFRTIGLLRHKFDSTDAIIEKIAAVPDLQQYEITFEDTPVIEDEPAPLDVIDELINNQKTFAVGSLVRWLWGGLNIPVHSTLPSQQPLGGISDLTNKGDLDKLLISEFANDDLFFLSRLANNEALYLHREIPPANNHLQRFVLIDASLKNWGTPKAVAFAVMLAIAKHPKTDIACAAFVLGSDNYYPVSVENIDTIIDALQIVEGALHAANSLAAFLKAHATDRNKEIFFITEPSTLRQPSLLKVMNEHHQHIHYQVLTDADGNVDVYKRYRNSKKHVQHIRLPLEDLWKKRPSTAPRDAPPVNKQPELLADYPILVRSTGNAKKILAAPDGEIFLLNNERAVLRLFDKSAGLPNHGWDLVCQNLPFKTDIFEVGISDQGQYVILLFNTPKREIFLLNLSTGENHTVIFKGWKSTAWPSFIFDAGKFLHYSDNKCWTISTGGVVEVDSAKYPRQEFFQRKEAIADVFRKYVQPHTMFKRINKVFINTSGELVFSKHTLHFVDYGKYLRLAPATSQAVKIRASTSDHRIFTFNDGSTVEVNRSGLFILKSSDSAIENLYIPTTLDFAVGVATPTIFAGNDYYYKGGVCEVILKDPGKNRLAAAKVIKESMEFSLQECKYFVDHGGPITLKASFAKQKAEDFRTAMKEVGADVEIRQAGTTAQTIMPREFIDKYLRRYIDTIINHGAQGHTQS